MIVAAGLRMRAKNRLIMQAFTGPAVGTAFSVTDTVQFLRDDISETIDDKREELRALREVMRGVRHKYGWPESPSDYQRQDLSALKLRALVTESLIGRLSRVIHDERYLMDLFETARNAALEESFAPRLTVAEHPRYTHSASERSERMNLIKEQLEQEIHHGRQT